jgi:hypothetical protein
MADFKKIVDAAGKIINSDDPANAAGKIVRTAVTAAHPIVGTVAGPLIEKGTEKAVNAGIDFVKNPDNQAKAKEIGGKVLDAGKNAFGSIASRTGEFFQGRGGTTPQAPPAPPVPDEW